MRRCHQTATTVALTLGGVIAGPLAAQSEKFSESTNTTPMAGEVAPDFTLQTLEGADFTLSGAYTKQPVVIEFGSYT